MSEYDMEILDIHFPENEPKRNYKQEQRIRAFDPGYDNFLSRFNKDNYAGYVQNDFDSPTDEFMNEDNPYDSF